MVELIVIKVGREGYELEFTGLKCVLTPDYLDFLEVFSAQ